jgi:hypothetical protein
MGSNVIRKVTELKESYIRSQDFEMAAKLRGLENSFTNSRFTEIHIEPTEENFKLEIIKIIQYFSKMNINTNGVRDLKLMLLLEF